MNKFHAPVATLNGCPWWRRNGQFISLVTVPPCLVINRQYNVSISARTLTLGIAYAADTIIIVSKLLGSLFISCSDYEITVENIFYVSSKRSQTVEIINNFN